MEKPAMKSLWTGIGGCFFKNVTKLPILVSKVSFWSHFIFEGRNVKAH